MDKHRILASSPTPGPHVPYEIPNASGEDSAFLKLTSPYKRKAAEQLEFANDENIWPPIC